jgi:dihydrodipicolinate synthase/N-acetylneuraminate lyase
MRREELKRLVKGPIATVPTAFDGKYEIDYGRMAEMTQWWVEQGLVAGKAVIKVAAAMGEGPMLRDTEWPLLLRTVVQAAKGKAAIVCGIHYKDTFRTIEDAKIAQDMGAICLQVNPPVFNLPTQDDLLHYYGDLSDAIDIGIMVYNTWWLGNGNVLPQTIMKMRDFEHVVSIKWSVPDDQDYDDMAKFSDVFSVIDNSSQAPRCYRLGGQGYINMTAEVYPAHDLRIQALLEAGRYDEAQALFLSVDTPLRDFYAKTAQASGGQARVKKGMMEVMGHPMGASRPPSAPLTKENMAELRQLLIGFGWPVP